MTLNTNMESNQINNQNSSTGKYLAISGSVLLLAVPISVVMFAVNMFFLFQETTLYGAGDTQRMADGISNALIPVVLGLVLVVSGLICLVVSLSIFKYYKPWVYRVSLFASILGLLMIPIGTILALIVITTLIVKRKKFREYN